jgi:hypothetical protein
MPVSWSDHRHLLVAEDGRVFLLAVDGIRSILDRLPVTLVCVSGNERPVYRGSLTVEGPLEKDDNKDTFKLTAKMESCTVPGEVEMEHGRFNVHVNPELLHGDDVQSLKVHLSICITKLP